MSELMHHGFSNLGEDLQRALDHERLHYLLEVRLVYRLFRKTQLLQ